MYGYAIRLLGHSWYIRHDKDAAGSTQKLNEAAIYDDRAKAESAALFLTSALPAWIKKVRVIRVKKIYIQKIYCSNPRAPEAEKVIQKVNVPHWVTC